MEAERRMAHLPMLHQTKPAADHRICEKPTWVLLLPANLPTDHRRRRQPTEISQDHHKEKCPTKLSVNNQPI